LHVDTAKKWGGACDSQIAADSGVASNAKILGHINIAGSVDVLNVKVPSQRSIGGGNPCRNRKRGEWLGDRCGSDTAVQRCG
jgi:hypothetical protein